MNSIKCSECGLVNWSTSSECRRCGASIGADYHNAPSRFSIDKEVRVEPLFSTGIKLLSSLLAFTTIICLAQQSLHPLSSDMAKQVAVFLAVAAMALFALAHIWCVIRIFEQSLGWGVASLFLPFAMLFAVGRFWQKTKRSFAAQCICTIIFFVGLAVAL
ncbi:MAG: hypothetical protein WAM70_03625 [Pyrinomonadaceae bacterium]